VSAASRPRQIRVGHLTYRVVVDAAEIQRMSNRNAEDDFEWTAFSDHDQLVIGINSGNPVAVQRQDMLHELLHCALRYAGVWPNAYAAVLAAADAPPHGGYTVEEFVVAAASSPLLGVLRDNPKLTRWLTS
jgi:hypothetical protein